MKIRSSTSLVALAGLALSLGLVGVLGACSGDGATSVSGNPSYRAEAATAMIADASPMSFDVANENGSVKVKADDVNEVKVYAKIRAQTQDRADRAVITTQRDSGGAMTVRVLWPDGERRNNESADIEIVTPRLASARVATNNGDVDVSGAQGYVDVVSNNGAVSVKGARQGVRVQTSNGKINVSDAMGQADLVTTNGNVSLHLDNGAMDVFRVRTSNGNVSASVPATWPGRIAFRTTGSRVTVNGPHRELNLRDDGTEGNVRFADGGGTSTIETNNGSVKVTGR